MNRKIAIVTDSNSGISQEQAKELGVFVVPMPFFINGELLFEGINLTHEEFYKKQSEGADITTSQPSPGDVIDLWNQILEEFDELLHIPMSSGLSGTCETSMVLARDYDGRVIVVDNCRISVTLKQAIMDAMKLVEEGNTAEEIKEILISNKNEARIYITVDDLQYLKKGGRITPAAAAIGSVLNIKPVLEIRDKKIDSYAKVRGWKQAKKTMFEAMTKDLEEYFPDKQVQLSIAYTCTEEELNKFLEEARAQFSEYNINVEKLSLSIATHIGAGAMAIACARIL